MCSISQQCYALHAADTCAPAAAPESPYSPQPSILPCLHAQQCCSAHMHTYTHGSLLPWQSLHCRSACAHICTHALLATTHRLAPACCCCCCCLAFAFSSRVFSLHSLALAATSFLSGLAPFLLLLLAPFSPAFLSCCCCPPSLGPSFCPRCALLSCADVGQGWGGQSEAHRAALSSACSMILAMGTWHSQRTCMLACLKQGMRAHGACGMASPAGPCALVLRPHGAMHSLQP